MNSWTKLVALVGLIIVGSLVCRFVAERKVAPLRARGVYPEKGKENDEDVLRLLKLGEEIMAIRCYRSLHGVGLKEAKEQVELLKQKNA